MENVKQDDCVIDEILGRPILLVDQRKHRQGGVRKSLVAVTRWSIAAQCVHRPVPVVSGNGQNGSVVT